MTTTNEEYMPQHRTHTHARRADKIAQLATQEGYADPWDLLDARGFDSLQPAICMRRGCDYSADMEPDQRAGYCEACQASTMESISVLAGVI